MARRELRIELATLSEGRSERSARLAMLRVLEVPTLPRSHRGRVRCLTRRPQLPIAPRETFFTLE